MDNQDLNRLFQQWLKANEAQPAIVLLSPGNQLIPIAEFGFLQGFLQENPGWQIGVMIVPKRMREDAPNT